VLQQLLGGRAPASIHLQGRCHQVQAGLGASSSLQTPEGVAHHSSGCRRVNATRESRRPHQALIHKRTHGPDVHSFCVGFQRGLVRAAAVCARPWAADDLAAVR
jgi:hypothetical protein